MMRIGMGYVLISIDVLRVLWLTRFSGRRMQPLHWQEGSRNVLEGQCEEGQRGTCRHFRVVNDQH